MRNAIFFTFLAISIALSIWALCSTRILSSRIQQNNDLLRETRKSFKEQNRDSLNDEIIKLKFEKSSYTELLDTQSNLTIGYVTLLFALFGITGLVISNRLAKDIKVDYQEEKSKIQGQFRAYRVAQERKYLNHTDLMLQEIQTFKNDFTQLKIDHLLSSANVWAICSTVFSDDLPLSFWTSILSACDNVECSKIKNNTEYNLDVIMTNLKNAKEIIEKVKPNPTQFIAILREDLQLLKRIKDSLTLIILFNNSGVSSMGSEILADFNRFFGDTRNSPYV